MNQVINKPLKRRLPEVKLNKASQLRIKKANPLPELLHDYSHLLTNYNNTVNNFNTTNLNNTENIFRCNQTLPTKPKRNFIKENAEKAAKFKKAPAAKQPLPSKSLQAVKVQRKVPKVFFHKRKSLSCDDINKPMPVINVIQPKTPSMNDVSNVTQHEKSVHFKSPVPEKIVFKTPSAYNRRSMILATPNTNPTTRKSMATPLPSFHLPSPTRHELQERLNKWLQKHGKPLSSYQNLKYFGLKKKDLRDDENKENVEIEENISSSYEDLGIDNKSNGDGKNADNENVPVLVNEVLDDLYNLISDEYPREQCEIWLQVIKEKYKNIDEEPRYWECRAALEEARGGINSALECYKEAIINGAPVKDIDEALDNLLKKFSLLDLNVTPTHKNYQTQKEKENVKNRKRIILEARNAFKSSIIQFAITEKDSKKKKENVEQQQEKQFIATPVRRSTRISRTSYICTPGVKLCSTLKREFDENQEQCIKFKTNKALI